MTLNGVMAVTVRYFTADKILPRWFMVLRGTVPPPHISRPALYCIFSTVVGTLTVIGLCRATKSVDLWRNLCPSLLYFVVRVHRDVKVSRPAWSRDHFFGLGLGLGLTVIGLSLGLGLMR